MSNIEDENLNVSVKKNKQKLKSKIISVSLLAVLAVFGSLYLFKESILEFITEKFLTTEYSDLKDEGISKYDVIKVKNVKAVDMNSKEEMEKLIM